MHVEDGKEQQNYTSQKYYDYSIDQVIIDMAFEGHTHVEIGKAVGRNAYAISLRLRTLVESFRQKLSDSTKSQSDYMLECEARFWKSWVRQNGRAAWYRAKERILRHRGEAGLQKLLDKMNEKNASAKQCASQGTS